ncbi:HEAT repeat domain-containing protein [Halolamina sp. C58]|uniref:HEAT repeat domain-containing protein n=1 Tax=Halolamina sp. C58 TaxID=3421640 RepID=UPI003EBB8BB2
MDEPTDPSVERLSRSVEAGDYRDATACLRAFETASAESRKAALRTLRENTGEQTAPLATRLTSFLTDDERSVRLTAAKLFVAGARADPAAVTDCVDALADRVGDEEEFYYVRARSAEALGYVALDHPDEVATPALLADLRVGLSFDEPEVREKLAKALASVAMGDPDRLRHHTSNLAHHLDDGNELVRYQLCTALAAIGCTSPAALADTSSALAARLDDENAYVRARAAEALGLLERADTPETDLAADAPTIDDPEPFVATRLQFLRDALAGATSSPDGVGTVDAIRETATEVEKAVDAPEESNACPHCGLSLGDPGPPTCPGCGAPR